MLSRFKTGALACALATVVAPSFAASTASASISNLQFQLFDLTPTDARDSAYSFNSLSGSLSTTASDSSLGASDSHTYTRAGLFTFNKSIDADADTAQAAASVSKTGLAASGSAQGAQTSFNASAGSNSPYYYGGTLKLSAHSVLIITADALVSASATNPSACSSGYYYYCNATETASASATLNLSYSMSTPAGSISGASNNSVSTSASARGGYTYQTWGGYDYSYYDWYNHPIYTNVTSPATEQSFSETRQFYAVFANTSDVDQYASLYTNVSVSGFASTGAAVVAMPAPSAVPEPDSIMLLAGGLFSVGFMLRRRRA